MTHDVFFQTINLDKRIFTRIFASFFTPERPSMGQHVRFQMQKLHKRLSTLFTNMTFRQLFIVKFRFTVVPIVKVVVYFNLHFYLFLRFGFNSRFIAIKCFVRFFFDAFQFQF